jgi:hypothetical protein
MGDKTKTVKSESKQELDPAAKAAMQKALAAADSIYSSRDPSGMSPEMRAAMQDSTNYYKSDAFRQPNQNMVNIGQGLLNGGMASNPFNNGRELGDGSGMSQILALMSKRQPRPEGGGGGYGGGQGMQGGGQGMRPRMQGMGNTNQGQGMGGGMPQGYTQMPQSMMAQGQPQGQFAPLQTMGSSALDQTQMQNDNFAKWLKQNGQGGRQPQGNPQGGYGLLPQTAIEPPSQPFIPQAQPQAQPDAFEEWQKNQRRYQDMFQNPHSGG